MQPWHTATIVRIEEETPSTRRFWFQVLDADRFDFKPGQFVTLELPIHEKPNKRWRSYSIASWPDGTNIFELVIVLLEDGAGTNYLFFQAGVGTELPFRGPLGVFVLPEPIDRDLFLICTGTGIAPFRSMVHHILLRDIPHKRIFLIFGCRLLCDGLYRDELLEVEKQLPGFRYLPTYSRETAREGLAVGYVHTVYETIIQAEAQTGTENFSLAPAHFFLCGWKNMIDEAKQRIIALGYDRKSVHQELYG